MANANIVGQRIQAIREKRQMAIEELAAAIPGDKAVNAELIKNLEGGDTVPSLTPLLQIARALGVRLGSFLDDQQGSSIVMMKSGKVPETNRFAGSNLGTAKNELAFHSLAPNKSDRHMEPFIVEVKPHTGDVVTSTHEGEEFIYVMSGRIEIVYGKETYSLAAGDSIYYDSIVPHHLHAAGEEEAKILAVIYAPF